MTLALLGVFSAYSVHSGISPLSVGALWKIGFGVVTAKAMVVGWRVPSFDTTGLIANVLIANLPQLLLSVLYLAYNGLYTAMLLADEWSRFGYQRKPLRVSDPKKDQRSTYFLQLPFKYAIPLLILSGVLHWLLSQSIFLARVSVSRWGWADPDGMTSISWTLTTCGCSPMAMIFLIILGVFMIMTAILFGLRGYKPGIPLVRSNSALIAAACHVLKDEPDAAFYPVQWGVVRTPGLESGVGHCSFSSKHVTSPMPECYYA